MSGGMSKRPMLPGWKPNGAEASVFKCGLYVADVFQDGMGYWQWEADWYGGLLDCGAKSTEREAQAAANKYLSSFAKGVAKAAAKAGAK